MNRPFRLLIVDDHPFFRQGVKFYLSSLDQFELVGECSSGEQALKLVSSAQPDVVLMDLTMAGMDGIDTTEALLAQNPDLRILIVTSFGREDTIWQALAAGAAGYCLKDAPPGELVTAITAVAEGGVYLGRGVNPRVLTKATLREEKVKTCTVDRLFATLTRREMDVLKLVARGLGNKEIARELFVSEKTVKTHVANILQKLNVNTRTQAALLANNHELV